MNCKTLFQNLIAICKKSSGFASILPLLIIALAAISSSTPLLVENLLNGNPPGQKIASNNVQQIAGLPEGETYKICDETGILISCSNDRIKTFKTQNGSGQTTYTECNTGLTCNKSGNCAWCVKKADTSNGQGASYCERTYGSGWSCDDNTTCNSDQVCKNANGNCENANWCVKATYNATCSEIEGAVYESPNCTSQSTRCTYENGICKDKSSTTQPSTDCAENPSVCNSNQTCLNAHGSTKGTCVDTNSRTPNQYCDNTSGSPVNTACNTGYCNPNTLKCSSPPSSANESTVTISTTINKINPVASVKSSSRIAELSNISIVVNGDFDGQPFSYTGVINSSSSPQTISTVRSIEKGSHTFKVTSVTANGSLQGIPYLGAIACPSGSGTSILSGCTLNITTDKDLKFTISIDVSKIAKSDPEVKNPVGGDDPVDNGPQQPAQKSEPISGTVNVVGSTTASQVTVSVNGSTYSASKDSGIAWKYKTADLPAGSYTVTATATLVNSNGTLSGTTTANSGSTTADITISAYSADIISEKCGAKGVSENSISGFLYTACMASSPTTLTEAEKGKFDQNKAALAKDNGNPYCGTNAFDVYQCKDGSIETIAIGESEDTCNKFPWCPEKGKTGLTTDPCAGPDNRPETCSCQPNSSSAANGKFTQDNCAKDLFCAPGKNPQIPGYACCPKYEQFCPATNTCIGTNESCGSGVKAPDPLPTNQQSLGCPNQNPDGTQNVCSTISSASSQPTDGIQSGNPGYNSSKNYTRNQNGDKACADNYASTKNANFKYCWKESGSTSSGGGGGGGTGGQQPGGGGSAGFIGKACPANPDKTSSSYLASECENKTDIFGEDYYCTKDFKNTTWACCQFGTRFCSLNNLCVSSENDCIAPTPIPNSGNGNTTQPGTAGGPGSTTNHCYNGQKDCTPGYLCSNPAGGSTAQCVVRSPEDPESNCATANGLECTDTYDASLNVDDALARDVCRSIGKKYCAKKAQPAQSGCPHALDTSGNKLSDSKSICQTSSTCPAGTKPGSSANNAACGTGQYCCIDTRYSGSTASTQSVASTPVDTCKTSKDCVSSRSGNACVYFTSSSMGICKTY